MRGSWNMGWLPASQTPGKLIRQPATTGRVKKPPYLHDAPARTERDLLLQRLYHFHVHPVRVEHVAHPPASVDLFDHQRIVIQPMRS